MTTCEWIKCAERMPEQGATVLVTVYGSDMIIPKKGESVAECIARQEREIVEVSIAFLGEDGWYAADGFPMVVAPTYWAEMPKPPKREK